MEKDKGMVSKNRASWQTFLVLVSPLVMFLVMGSVVLWKLSSEGIAKGLITHILVQQFSRDGVDNEQEVEELRAELRKDGGCSKVKLGAEFQICLDDFEGMSARESRYFFFGRVADRIYADGLESFELGSVNTGVPKALMGPLGEVNSKLAVVMGIMVAIGLVFLVSLKMVLWGWGQAIWPGLALVFGSLPWAAVTLLLSGMVEKAPESIVIVVRTLPIIPAGAVLFGVVFVLIGVLGGAISFFMRMDKKTE